ncbi:MAG: FGGY family carbohydrate kinase [Thermoprotei archaeon]
MLILILALDEGTTNSKAILFSLGNQGVKAIARSSKTLGQSHPKPDWSEQDPEEIWNSTLLAAKQVLEGREERLEAISITNQRETAVVWDAESGRPLYNAISWQDRRTADLTGALSRDEGLVKMIREKTGLLPDPYFSASKFKWMLDNVPGLREKALTGQALFGTVDSFLIWKLSGGKSHVTDFTNASRTMLFNIRKQEWDEELLELFGIPAQALPEPMPSSYTFGHCPSLSSELVGALGDQSAALLGQAALDVGQAKATYGTGTFVLANTGREPIYAKGLLTTLAWDAKGLLYALEGSAFSSGSALDWITSLGMTSGPSDAESLATSINDTGGVYFVPALSGLGSPFWDPTAKAMFAGITSSVGRAHLVRAVMESIAYQVEAILGEIRAVGISTKELRVDGGVSNSDFLMQFQADTSGLKVARGEPDSTALGAAYLAGIGMGKLKQEDIKSFWKPKRVFMPSGQKGHYAEWLEVVRKAIRAPRGPASRGRCIA